MNDGIIMDINEGGKAARMLAEQGITVGDTVFVTPNGAVLEQQPKTPSDLQDAEGIFGNETYFTTSALSHLGVVACRHKTLHQKPNYDYRESYRELELIRDPAEFVLPDLYAERRPGPEFQSFRDIIDRFRQHKMETAIAGLGAGTGTVFYFEGVSAPNAITGLGLIVGGIATFQTLRRPYKHFTQLARDKSHAANAYQWWVDAQAEEAEQPRVTAAE